MKIGIGSDHAGFDLKALVIQFLKDSGNTVYDMGTFSSDPVDYPDYVHPLCNKIESGELEKGILICGSGNGVAITANKHTHIRAGLCWSVEIAELARKHNNINILCLPSRFISAEEALEMVNAFLNTHFEGGRHLSRVNKIPPHQK